MPQTLITNSPMPSSFAAHALEILIMLLVSFALGFLIRSAFSKKSKKIDKSELQIQQLSKTQSQLQEKLKIAELAFEKLKIGHLLKQIEHHDKKNQNISSDTSNSVDLSADDLYDRINELPENSIQPANTIEVAQVKNAQQLSANLFHHNLTALNDDQSVNSPIKFNAANSQAQYEAANLYSQLHEYKLKHQKLEQELELKNNEIGQLSSQMAQWQSDQSKPGSTILQDKPANQILDQLAAQLNIAQNEAKEFHQQLENIQTEHLEDLGAVRHQLEQQFQQDIEKSKQNLQSELDLANAQTQQLWQQLQNAQGEVALLQQQIEQSINKQNQYAAENSSLKNQSDDLARAFDSAMQEWFVNRQQLETALKNKESEICNLNQQISQS